MAKHLHLNGFVALVTAFAASIGAYAAVPIGTAAELAAIGNDLSGEYELTADITLTGEWTPIGTELTPFTGTFDGKGHTISGLSITDVSVNNGNGVNYAGLFGLVTGSIKNVSIVDVNIYANEHVGIAAGRVCGGGLVDNVFTAGYVNGRDHAGGIVGDAGDTDQTATVSNCISAAYVRARDYQGGGIVGWSKGIVTIENNVFFGEASCGAWGAAAGIVAFIEDGTTTVKHNVNAARKLTGQVQTPPDDNPYNFRRSAGIVGNCYNDKSILISVDNLTSDATVIYGNDGEVADQSVIPVDYNGLTTPAADLKKAAAYTGLGFNASALKFVDGNYPVLSFVTIPMAGDVIHSAVLPQEIYVENTFDFAPVSSYGRDVTISISDNSVATLEGTTLTFVKAGALTVTLTTKGDSFCKGASVTFTTTVKDFDGTIASVADLAKLSANPSGNFVLTADLDMTGVDFKPYVLSGSFDGQGHWIRNLSFNNAETGKVAFFSEFSGDFIKNVGFDGANLVGNADVAAVVGETSSDGVISNVVVTNSYIEGRDHVASIVGKLGGGATIVNCIANPQIYTRQYQAGGIVGVGIKGTVDKCIFAGTIASSGTTNQAGIVALLDDNNVTIKNCLAATATYTNNQNHNANIVNVYSREIVLENNYVATYSIKNGVLVTAGETNGENGGAASKEDVCGQQWCSGTLGLDFTNDWKFLPGAEGYMLPVLKWMNAPIPTVLFNLPSVDGANVTYFEGTEFYDYSGIMGSWAQSITVTQISGEDYACILDGLIYVGNEDGELPNGTGTASFKVSFDPQVDGLFSLSGRDTFDVNVSLSGEEKTITTVEEFLKIGKNPAGKYTLGADIDLAGVEFNGFCNDGGSSFSGTLDGAGHSVKNFNLKFDGSQDRGLFGKTAGATIKNIAFTQFVIDGGTSGAKHVGLIGAGSAYLENVAIVGDVIGNDHVGLVAGDADGIEMLNCYAVGTIVAGSQIGGFFGCTLEGGCTLENCLSNVDAQSTYRGWVGGFVGLIDKAKSTVTIKNCVSIGNCTANGDGTPHVAAPFIAGNGAGEDANAVINFSGNIYNSAAVMAGDTDWPGNHETAEGGVVESASAANPNTLTAQNTYTAIGWDFANVWKMGEGEYKYPVLAGVDVTDFTTGVENVISDAKSNVRIAGANGEITVAGLGSASVITVYTPAGVQVAAATVNGAEAVVAVPANGIYIVSVYTDGAVATAKVVVK